MADMYMVVTFTLRSLQSRHPDRDFLSKGPRRWVGVFPESIKILVLSFRFVMYFG